VAVDKGYRGKRLSNYLIDQAREILDKESENRNNNFEEWPKNKYQFKEYVTLANYLNMTDIDELMEHLKRLKPNFYVEVDKETSLSENNEINPDVRIKIYKNLGFEKSDVLYYQAPLSIGSKAVEMYLFWHTKYGLSLPSLIVWLWEFWFDVKEELVDSELFFNITHKIKSSL
jgi:hypothetical protein